jgi:hypothetical protein
MLFVTGRRKKLCNLEFRNLCSESDIINVNSRWIKRVGHVIIYDKVGNIYCDLVCRLRYLYLMMVWTRASVCLM